MDMENLAIEGRFCWLRKLCFLMLMRRAHITAALFDSAVAPSPLQERGEAHHSVVHRPA